MSIGRVADRAMTRWRVQVSVEDADDGTTGLIDLVMYVDGLEEAREVLENALGIVQNTLDNEALADAPNGQK